MGNRDLIDPGRLLNLRCLLKGVRGLIGARANQDASEKQKDNRPDQPFGLGHLILPLGLLLLTDFGKDNRNSHLRIPFSTQIY